MRYTLQDGVTQKKRRPWLVVFALLSICGGLYLLYNTLAPVLPDYGSDVQATAKKLKTVAPQVGENRIYMPQINVDIALVEINGDETAALDKGAIHRAPTSGNPKDGGNFVVAAHRFTLGLTPSQTRAKSPFYHIDKMNVGDQIYVDYEGVRYAYRIDQKKTVAATAVEIEDRTEKPRLTLYSCELSGSRDGREVLFASPVGTVTWENGQPAVQSTTY